MEKILVTGATGKLGTEVVDLLLDKLNPEYLAVLVRDPSKAEHIKTKGVHVHQGDYNNYSSLVNAFQGIDKLYFISSNAMVDREEQHKNVIKAAVETKVKHIVYTSFQRKNEDDSPIRFITDVHVFTDKLIENSGLTYTILKHGLYADFIPILIGDKFIETGNIILPAGNGKAAFTLRSDLAAGAVEILTGKGHENKTYEFCAEKLYDISDIASMLTEIMGKTITYYSPTQEEFKDALTKAAVPSEFIALIAGCAEGIRQGEFNIIDNTLSKLLKRESTDMYTFLNNIYNN